MPHDCVEYETKYGYTCIHPNRKPFRSKYPWTWCHYWPAEGDGCLWVKPKDQMNKKLWEYIFRNGSCERSRGFCISGT